MVVGFGRTCPKGSLPVYAVADAKEATDLIVMACSRNGRGEYIADELAQEQTLDNLELFSERLNRMHEVLKKNGHCRCNTTPAPTKAKSATP